jgi:hypothetical protein
LLGDVLYANACAALFYARNDDQVERDAARIATVAPLLKQIYRRAVLVLEAKNAEPVPLGDHPDATLWRHITALGEAAHSAEEALRSRGRAPRQANSSRDGERRAFVRRFLRLSERYVHGQAVASGLAYFAIEAGLDDPPTPRNTSGGESLSAAQAFRRDNVKRWQKLLREMRTTRKRGARPRKNR